MIRVSKKTIAEDSAAPLRPDMLGIHVWWLVTQDTVTSRTMVLNIAELPPGAIHWLHRHPHADQSVVVMSGSALCFGESESFPVQAGEVVHVPAMEWHGLANLRNERVAIVTIYGGVATQDDAGYELHPAAEQRAQSLAVNRTV